METDGKEGADGEKKEGDKADNEPEKSFLTESKYWFLHNEDIEQRTRFCQGNHILPYFTTIIFNALKQILAISFICWLKHIFDFVLFIGIKEINLFMWKMQKL